MTGTASADRISSEACRATTLRVLDRITKVSRVTKQGVNKHHFGCLVILSRDGSTVYEECFGVSTPGVGRMLGTSAHKRIQRRISGDSTLGRGALTTKTHALAWVSEKDVAVDELITVAIASRLRLCTLEKARRWLNHEQNPFTCSRGDCSITKLHYLALLGYREHLGGLTVFMDEK